MATNLTEAFDQLHSPPDWIILDLMLPDGDGLTLLDAVRRKRLPIRVAITTGTNDPAKLQAAEALHPDTLIQKPIDLQQLLSTLASPGGSETPSDRGP